MSIGEILWRLGQKAQIVSDCCRMVVNRGRRGHRFAKAFLADRQALFHPVTTKTPEVIGIFDLTFPIDQEFDWHHDYYTGTTVPRSFAPRIHIRETCPVGDIKYIWEISRHQYLSALALTDWGRQNQSWIIFIRFEDLLENTEEVTKKLTTFLGLDWSANMLEHHMYTQRIFEGKFNYGQPIKATNTGKWKTALPARQVRRIEAIAYDTMQVFGYQVEYAEHYAPIGRIRRFMGKLRDLYAIIFRVKSQFSHLCC